jgi:hypothetical protein
VDEPALGKVASLLGVRVDDLSNVDTDKYLPIFHTVDVTTTDLVEAYSTGGCVDCEVSENHVVWKGEEKYNGANMESPCIERSVLKKWLGGNYGN